MSSVVLITGADGQLAQAIYAAAQADFLCVRRKRVELDITSREAIESTLTGLRPAMIINGAAYNAVDAAEDAGFEAAIRINTFGPGRLAIAAAKRGIPLVHFSTDLVFDGNKRTPYTEADLTRPLGNYGASKLAGENIVLAASPRNFVVRVCRLFGPTFSDQQGSPKKPYGNFPRLMLRLAKEKGSVTVVNDQIGTPTYTPDLASAIWQLTRNADGGLFQLTNAGEVSYSDYAKEIFRIAGVTCAVNAVSSSEYGAPARRPLYSVMDNSKAVGFGVREMRPWADALREFLSIP
jgi:dTDP-4-dehydrorhamnose reductase